MAFSGPSSRWWSCSGCAGGSLAPTWCRLRGPGEVADMGGAADLPRTPGGSARRADLAALRGLRRRVLRCRAADHLRDLPAAGISAVQPEHFAAVRADTAWNTSVSFVTNTNWQSYSGETTMSYLSQMGALAVQNFLSAAVGMSVAVALIRGFARKVPDDRQLLGRPGAQHRLHPVADRLRRRDRLHLPGRGADPQRRRRTSTTHSTASTRSCSAGPSPPKR